MNGKMNRLLTIVRKHASEMERSGIEPLGLIGCEKLHFSVNPAHSAHHSCQQQQWTRQTPLFIKEETKYEL